MAVQHVYLSVRNTEDQKTDKDKTGGRFCRCHCDKLPYFGDSFSRREQTDGLPPPRTRNSFQEPVPKSDL